MRSIQLLFCLISCSLVVISCQQESNSALEHNIVYFESDRFGGWPANNGIWIWGDEILVGFLKGYHKYLGEERHNIDREKPQVHMFARSIDGGENWTIEDPSTGGVMIARGESLHGTEPDPDNMKPITKLQEPMDFSNPNFLMKFWMLNMHTGPSIFYYSDDKGHTWNGPFSLSVDGHEKISARVDYMIEDNNSLMAFMTSAKSNDHEGRVFTTKTDDGGLTWQLVSWVGEEPEKGFRIMPSTVRTSENELILTSRVREELTDWNELSPKERKNSRYIDSWISNDNAISWKFLGKPVSDLGEGNPPSLIILKDGSLCLTYGVRSEPYSICAKISKDNGRTWGKQITLRNDGAGRDIGYVRSIQRPDGKVVTIYYFQDKKRPERYIACTIWDPNSKY